MLGDTLTSDSELDSPFDAAVLIPWCRLTTMGSYKKSLSPLFAYFFSQWLKSIYVIVKGASRISSLFWISFLLYQVRGWTSRWLCKIPSDASSHLWHQVQPWGLQTQADPNWMNIIFLLEWHISFLEGKRVWLEGNGSWGPSPKMFVLKAASIQILSIATKQTD